MLYLSAMHTYLDAVLWHVPSSDTYVNIITSDLHTYVENTRDIVENYINSDQGHSLHVLFL